MKIYVLDSRVIKFVGVKYTKSWTNWNAFVTFFGTWNQIGIPIPKFRWYHYGYNHCATFLFKYVYYNNPLQFQVSNLSIWCKLHSWLYIMHNALVLVYILLCTWTFLFMKIEHISKCFEFILHFGHLEIILCHQLVSHSSMGFHFAFMGLLWTFVLVKSLNQLYFKMMLLPKPPSNFIFKYFYSCCNLCNSTLLATCDVASNSKN